MPRHARRPAILVSALLGLILLVLLAAYVGTRVVQARVTDWLGPDGHAAGIDVGLQSVVLRDVVLGAPSDWPVRQSLRAGRVELQLRWLDFLSERTVVRRATVEDFHLAVLRAGQGRIDILPTIRQRAREKAQERGGRTPRETRITALHLQDGSLDFHDAVIAEPAHRISFDQVRATLGPLAFPLHGERTQVRMTGQLAGERPGGTVSFQGWVALGSGDADIETRLQGADIEPLKPYLQKGRGALLASGNMDMAMRTRMADRKLDASGEVVLHRLQLQEDGLAALPRKAVLAALEDEQGRLRFRYTVKGEIGDPEFQIEDSLSAKVAGGLAEAVGLSIGGIASGVAGAVQGLAGALSGQDAP